MLIDLLKTPTPESSGKRESDPKSLSATIDHKRKVDEFFLGAITASSFNEIG